MGAIRRTAGLIINIGLLAGISIGCGQQNQDLKTFYNGYLYLNGDNRQDIISESYRIRKGKGIDYEFTVQFSNPDGTYQAPISILNFKEKPNQTYITDIEGDGDLDLVVSRYTDMTYDTYASKNDGQGNFGELELISSQERRGQNSQQPREFFNGCLDLNGDKREEIISQSYRTKKRRNVDYRLSIQFANPDGTYPEPKSILELKNAPNQINFTDLEGDGDMDLVFSEYTGTDYDTYASKNDGQGNFGKPEIISIQRR